MNAHTGPSLLPSSSSEDVGRPPGQELRDYTEGGARPRDGARFLREGANADPAFVFDGEPPVTVGDLREATAALAAATTGTRRLFAVVLRNRPAALTACFAALAAGHAAVVVPDGQPALLDHVVRTFDVHAVLGLEPEGLRFAPPSLRHQRDLGLHPELALMLSTSGTTGDTRFVRLSYRNLLSNGLSIADYLQLGPAERPLLALPAHYSFGLSVLTSHRLVGAPVLVTDRSIADEGVQAFLRLEGATSVSGVPHTYALLERTGFLDAPPPTLRTLTQAGGRLPEPLARRLAAWGATHGVKVVVMYGQTEASPRIAWLPPESLAEHPDCIGRAIPGGRIELRDDTGRIVERPGEEGELVYHGPNVMMGYATALADLSLPPGDPVLATGDMATWEPGGLLRVTGRRSRMLKLFGLRLSLDRIERRLEADGVRAVCGGDDERLLVMAERADPQAVRDAVAAIAGLPSSVVFATSVDALPLLASGKPDVRRIQAELVAARAEGRTGAAPAPGSPAAAAPSPARVAPASAAPPGPPARAAAVDDLQAVRAVFEEVFPRRSPADHDSFVTLGGDSMTFVAAAVRLEPLLGTMPRQWERLTLAQLAERAAAHRASARASARGVSMEAALVIRAIAPLLVVLNHAGQSWLAGGAVLLLAVAGFNVARFQLVRLLRGEFAAPVLGFVRNVLVPFWLVIGAWQLLKQQFNPLEMLLVTNFLPDDLLGQSPFGTWFIDVVAQCMLLTVLVSAIRPLRVAARRHEYRFALVFVGFGVLLHALETLVPQAEDLAGRTPTWVAWVFAMGLLIHATRSRAQRLLTSALAVVLPMVLFSDDPSRIVILSLGCLALLWIERVRVPRWFARAAGVIASASLFIYMLHQRAPVDSFTAAWPVDVVRIVVGVALGIAGWWLYERTVARWLPGGGGSVDARDGDGTAGLGAEPLVARPGRGEA